MIIGTPDKTFINATPVYKGRAPIDGIIDVFQIYSNAQVWSDRCLAKFGINEAGYKHILWTCDYSGYGLSQKDELCDYIYDYVNGGSGGYNILGDTVTHQCTVVGNKFYIDVVAKSK